MEDLQEIVPEVYTVPVTYRGVEREFPMDIQKQRRKVLYLVNIDGVSIGYESDGVDGLYTNFPSDPQAMDALPPIGLVHAVKNALRTMTPA